MPKRPRAKYSDYAKLARNINRQLYRIEASGTSSFHSGYQEVKHAMGRIARLKTAGGRISTKQGSAEDYELLKAMASKLSMKQTTVKIKRRMQEEGISKQQAIEQLKAESIFNRMTETLPAFFSSSQLSELIKQYDTTPDFEDWLTDILREHGRKMRDSSPEEFEELKDTWKDYTGNNDMTDEEFDGMFDL